MPREPNNAGKELLDLEKVTGAVAPSGWCGPVLLSVCK